MIETRNDCKSMCKEVIADLDWFTSYVVSQVGGNLPPDPSNYARNDILACMTDLLDACTKQVRLLQALAVCVSDMIDAQTEEDPEESQKTPFPEEGIIYE